MSFKYGDILTKFDGTSDFAQWIEKVELVASLQNISAIEKFFPLFLTGSAFSCYQSVDKEVKEDYVKLKEVLIQKFCSDPCLAYEELIRRRLQTGEEVEAYYSDVRRLASLADPKISEQLIKSAFLAGLPADVKEKIRSSNDVTKLGLQELITRAKTIVKAVDVCAAAVIGVEKDAYSACVANDYKPTCLSCGKQGHLSKNCFKLKRVLKCFHCDSTDHLVGSCPKRFCFVCGDRTHIAPNCPKKSGPKN